MGGKNDKYHINQAFKYFRWLIRYATWLLNLPINIENKNNYTEESITAFMNLAFSSAANIINI